jgi:hypothetical protein
MVKDRSTVDPTKRQRVWQTLLVRLVAGIVLILTLPACGSSTETSTFQGDATANDTSAADGCEPLPDCTSRTECTGSCGNACVCDPSAAYWSCSLLCNCDAEPGGCGEPSPLDGDGGKDVDSGSEVDASDAGDAGG